MEDSHPLVTLNSKHDMNRLDFLKYTVGSLLVPSVLQAGNTFRASSLHEEDFKKKEMGKAHYWNKNTRLTIAMWDFSWLSDQGKGGSYENIERRVEEAALRGYNTLRVDCFPSRLLQEETSFHYDEFGGYDIIPGWGKVTSDFSCNALGKLKQLADACRKHHIWLGLDSWEKDKMIRYGTFPDFDYKDIIPEAKEEKVFRDFSHTWVKAIRRMREEGILERAVWIAPMNEVPHFATRNLESIRRISEHDKNEGSVQLDKNRLMDDRLRQINHWMAEEIKSEIDREKIPLSYSSLGSEDYANRLTDLYDVVDVHFMPPVICDSEDTKQFDAIAKGSAIGRRFSDFEKIDLKRWSEVWDQVCRRHYCGMLRRTRQYMLESLQHMTLPSGKKLQAVVTEPYGPCYWPDHKDVSWTWYKYYNADSARITASLPFEGVSLSNYGEPLFSLWEDEDWHRNANLFTLTALE